MDENDPLEALRRRHALPGAYEGVVEAVARPLAGRIAAQRAATGRPLVVGLCGSQGSGKSTLAAFLAALLEAEGLSTAVMSVDDLYLDREERRRLAGRVHELLATRGPPGSHDVTLGLTVLDALTREDGAAREIALPHFDKANDAAFDPAGWPRVRAPVDVVLFEGWFVGARPQPTADLTESVNALEREEDADGAWRRHVNAALAGGYQALFARIDLLVLLQAPGFEQVYAWRALQEEKLAADLETQGRPGKVMDAAALHRFIAHYERLTRWILSEMPQRADVVVRLGTAHEVLAVTGL